MTTTDPTAGEREAAAMDALETLAELGYPVPCDPEGIPVLPEPTSTPAVAASTGTSEDVEALATFERLLGQWQRGEIPVDVLLSVLAAREAATRAAEHATEQAAANHAEQIIRSKQADVATYFESGQLEACT